MKKTILFISMLLINSLGIYGQNVGIGTNTPNSSAKLHIEDANKGILIPRVSLADVTNGTTPVATPAPSLLVYNTNAAVMGGNGEGFYYWNSSQWIKITSSNDIDHDWYEVGTTTAPDNINDNIFTQGNVGISENTPTYKIHIINNTTTNQGGMYLNAGLNNSGKGLFIDSKTRQSSENNVPLLQIDAGLAGGNNTAFWVNTSGQIGIGTTTPASKLHIQGEVPYIILEDNVSATSTTGAVFTSFRHNGAEYGWVGDGSNGNEVIALFANGTNNDVKVGSSNGKVHLSTGSGINDDRLTVNQTGNVGIGTITPEYALDIERSATSQLRLRGGQNGFANAEVILQATSDINVRALGTFMHDVNAQNEWFTGRPYGNGLGSSDMFIISRYTGSATHYSGTSGIDDGAGNPTGSTIFMAVRNTGYTGFGITNPRARLHVAAAGNNAVDYTAKFVSSPSTAGAGGIVFTNTEATTATGFKWHTQGTGVGTFADDDLILSSIAVNSGTTTQNNLFTIQGNGNIGLGIVNSANPIQHSSGARLTAAGVWTNASDRRLKTNILTSKYGLKEILQLHSVDYTMKKDGSAQVGFIAQEVQKIVPEVVNGKEGDIEKGETLGIAYGQLVPVLTKAIQEQQAIIDTQAKKIAALEINAKSKDNSLEKLRTSLDSMNNRLQQLEEVLPKTAQK